MRTQMSAVPVRGVPAKACLGGTVVSENHWRKPQPLFRVRRVGGDHRALPPAWGRPDQGWSLVSDLHPTLALMC